MAATKRILVTGVGGAPGFDLTRHLMALGCEVIAADADPLACGLALQGVVPLVLPTADDPDYAFRLLEACGGMRPDGLLSTVEHELPVLVCLRPELTRLGARTWLPHMDAVMACIDKAAFYAVLSSRQIPTPATFLPHELDEAPARHPLVVKPRRGQGTQGVHFCETRQQAQVLCQLVPDPIVQERIHGQEFTADCLVDHAGRTSVVLRHRLLVKAGLSMVSRTFHDEEVADQVTRTLEALGMVGPCCAQGFICEDSNDDQRVIMTEVNARFAGAFPLAEAAGAALVQQTLNGLFDEPIDHDRLTYKPDIYLIKCFETLVSGTWHPAAVSYAHEREG
ncbi:ATP-grasp domain-containing protein [Streptomyces sp. NPDC102360]|uniref:ATP-grasp domain-containing protein n=1 Tax=Streptomyces sp. NPDC102360 TaxID=3366160 RepID=UPI0037FCB897